MPDTVETLAAPQTDFAARAADTVEQVVGLVRDKAVTPITVVARALVYGLLATFAGTAAFVLLTIGLVRGVDILIPGNVWRAHLAIGGLFTVIGLLSWSQRRPKAGKED